MLSIWSICIEEIDFVCGRDLGTDKSQTCFFFLVGVHSHISAVCAIGPRGDFQTSFDFSFL